MRDDPRVNVHAMAIRTREQFLQGLDDGRRVHYQGRLLDDVLGEPDIRRAAERSALAFDMQHDATYRDLAVDTAGGEETSAMFTVPRGPNDLRRRSELIETASTLGGCLILLKEVGTDALFALLGTLEGDQRKRAMTFYEHCRAGDLAVAVAQTDVKGDRSLAPREQADPDLYLRVVDEDADHIVVRGAKCHTSFSPYADELLVLPTRAMAEADRDYAVAFAVPIDTPGLHLYASPYLSGERNEFDHPLSSRFSLIESLTVFDDVAVPKDRVFLDRRPEQAGALALTFANYHRFTGVMFKLPLVDLIVGAAYLVAEANGITRASHVRDKLARLVRWSETVRGLMRVATVRSAPDAAGVQLPDPLSVNMAKLEFAHGYHDAAATLLDLAGGLVATGPGGADWDDPETRAVLEKYYAAAVPAEERLRVLNLIADLTARDYGGYQAVVASHAEGSLEAEKMQLLRSHAPDRAVGLARRMAGLDGSAR